MRSLGNPTCFLEPSSCAALPGPKDGAAHCWSELRAISIAVSTADAKDIVPNCGPRPYLTLLSVVPLVALMPGGAKYLRQPPRLLHPKFISLLQDLL